MTKKQLKQKVQDVMRAHYGFAPTQREIILLEADGDGSYILFGLGNVVTTKHGFRAYEREIRIDRYGIEVNEYKEGK